MEAFPTKSAILHRDKLRRAEAALEEEAASHYEREARYARERDPGGKQGANRRARELQDLAGELREEIGE